MSRRWTCEFLLFARETRPLNLSSDAQLPHPVASQQARGRRLTSPETPAVVAETTRAGDQRQNRDEPAPVSKIVRTAFGFVFPNCRTRPSSRRVVGDRG